MARARHNEAEMQGIATRLAEFEQRFPLPGVRSKIDRDVLIKQLIDSIRRVDFVEAIRSRPISERRLDPGDDIFDPVRAAIRLREIGSLDEACWLVFLFAHFGKHLHSKWRYIRDVYGKFGERPNWSWAEVAADPAAFRVWLRANEARIGRGSRRGFGGHRRYVSLNADSASGTGAAVTSYVEWVARSGGHRALIDGALRASDGNPEIAFDGLYRSMSAVRSFGRLAKFDYLTMLGKTGIAPIVPPRAYLRDATGPLSGARLLLQGSTAKERSIDELEARLKALSHHLGVDMQVVEDALCNWQKSPSRYVLFRG